jgi:hypothetical protein
MGDVRTDQPDREAPQGPAQETTDVSALNIVLIAVAAYLGFGLLLGAQFLHALATVSSGRSFILRFLSPQRRAQARENAQGWLDDIEKMGITHGRFVAGMAIGWPAFLLVLMK